MTLFLPKNKKGFTLVELMITVILIGILMAIVINFVFSLIEKSHISVIQSDLLSAYRASALYHIDNSNDTVDLNILKSIGYNPSKGVTINVVDGSLENLQITGIHPAVSGIFEVDKGGHVSRQ